MLDNTSSTIPFTQYLRPNGRTVAIFFECDDQEIYKKAMEVIKAGAHFDAEELQTGDASFTCEKDDELICIQVCPNGPEVIEAVNTLVTEAHNKLIGEQHGQDTQPNNRPDIPARNKGGA